MSKPLVSLDHPVIAVMAVFGRDAETLAAVVEHAGVRPRICVSAEEVCGAFKEAAAILITEESLAAIADVILTCLREQPAWSDIPLIILGGGRGRSSSPARWEFFRKFGNVTILDRPLSAEALMIALEAACRARAWQYVVRDQMQKLEAQTAELESKVVQRTAALQTEIEERKRMESALNEARRLEAIGRLSGGIAHDFNNLLQVVSASCNLLPFVKHDEARTDSLIDTIMRATERGSKLTHQLLAFGRRQMLSTDALDLAQHVIGMKELLQQSLREKIVFELRLQADLWHAHADVTQLEVALLNLTINAKDVLPQGGTVTLAARNIRLPSPQIPEVTELSGDFIWLSVIDTGPGMPKEVAEKAFEPFFTTKRVGEGSGLGLSQVYGFAKQSGGDAWIRSGPEGTTVSLLLPRGVPGKSGAGDRRRQHIAEGSGRLNGLHVLCVEDDEAVGELAVSLLHAFGCSAHWVRDADEALRMDLQQYDIVFSDVQMPGSMDGISLAKEISRRRPELPILLASGYVVAPERLRELQVGLIAKPYTAEVLKGALVGCLGEG